MADPVHNQIYSNESQNPQQWQKKVRFEEAEDAVLDDLDSSTFDMAVMQPPQHSQHRMSFAGSPSIMPPRQQAWSGYAFSNDGAVPTHPLSNTANMFSGDGSQYYQPDVASYSDYSNHVPQWQLPSAMEADTPTMAVNSFATNLDAVKPEETYNDELNPSLNPNRYGGLPIQSGSEYQQDPISVASPQWSTSSSDVIARKPKNKDFRSPMSHHSPAHLRQVGVRKKNTRFPIPEDRNIHTIDQMIAECDPADEETIKEFKHQKRLLRNRQAAYVFSHADTLVVTALTVT